MARILSGNISFSEQRRFPNIYITGGEIFNTDIGRTGTLKEGHFTKISSQILSLTGTKKDGDAYASDFDNGSGTNVMGGEYWFDIFNINDDIEVDDTIGWLVIRANLLSVSKAGGAIINGKGKSGSVIGTGGTRGTSGSNAVNGVSVGDYNSSGYLVGNILGLGATSGSSGGGGSEGSGSGATGAGGDSGILSQINSFIIPKKINGGISRTGGSDMTGGDGGDGISIGEECFNYLILNPYNYGQSSPGGGGGTDDGTSCSDGADGVKGGAGIALYCKDLYIGTNLEINSDGEDGVSAGGSGDYGEGGASGGGGAGSNLIIYKNRSYSGTITQSALGGNKGIGSSYGGDGGDGGDGICILYDIEEDNFLINGS